MALIQARLTELFLFVVFFYLFFVVFFLLFFFSFSFCVFCAKFTTANDEPERDPTAWTMTPVLATGPTMAAPQLAIHADRLEPPMARRAAYPPIRLAEPASSAAVSAPSASTSAASAAAAAAAPASASHALMTHEPPVAGCQLEFSSIRGHDQCIQLSFVRFVDSAGNPVDIAGVRNPHG